jgi:hypothetical protein
MLTDDHVPPDKPGTRTFLVFDRSTGEILSIHHMSATSGTSLPDSPTLEAQALRTVAASVGCAEETLAVTAHETGDFDPACLEIDVNSRRVIRVNPKSM